MQVPRKKRVPKEVFVTTQDEVVSETKVMVEPKAYQSDGNR